MGSDPFLSVKKSPIWGTFLCPIIHILISKSFYEIQRYGMRFYVPLCDISPFNYLNISKIITPKIVYMLLLCYNCASTRIHLILMV